MRKYYSKLMVIKEADTMLEGSLTYLQLAQTLSMAHSTAAYHMHKRLARINPEKHYAVKQLVEANKHKPKRKKII